MLFCCGWSGGPIRNSQWMQQSWRIGQCLPSVLSLGRKKRDAHSESAPSARAQRCPVGRWKGGRGSSWPRWCGTEEWGAHTGAALRPLAEASAAVMARGQPAQRTVERHAVCVGLHSPASRGTSVSCLFRTALQPRTPRPQGLPSRAVHDPA